MWYGYFGMKAMSTSEAPLSETVEFEVDGKPLKLSPNLLGLIVLNVNSYAGGVPLWNVTKDKKESHVSINVIVICIKTL